MGGPWSFANNPGPSFDTKKTCSSVQLIHFLLGRALFRERLQFEHIFLRPGVFEEIFLLVHLGPNQA